MVVEEVCFGKNGEWDDGVTGLTNNEWSKPTMYQEAEETSL